MTSFELGLIRAFQRTEKFFLSLLRIESNMCVDAQCKLFRREVTQQSSVQTLQTFIKKLVKAAVDRQYVQV